MRLRYIAIAALVTAAAGCGSSGGGASLASLADVQTAMAKGGVACKGKPGPYRSHSGDLDIGVKPVESLECTTSDGVMVNASRFNSAKDREGALAAVKSMICSMGSGDTEFVASGPFLISTGDDTMTKDDHRVLMSIATTLSQKVTKPCGGTADVGTLADAKGTIGAPVALGDDTSYTLTNPRLGGDESGPWIEVDVAYKNSSSTSAQPPEINVLCAGSDDAGNYQASSTFDYSADVKPGASSTGTLALLPAGNERIGEGVAECASPAVFRLGSEGGPTVPVPADVLSAYNAKAKTATG